MVESTMRLLTVIATVGIAFHLSVSETSGRIAAPPRIPDEVSQSFSSKRDIGPLTVIWSQQYEQVPTTPKDIRLPRRPSHYYAKTKHKLVWDQGKFYSSMEHPSTTEDNKLVMTRQEASCDGQICYVGDLDGVYAGKPVTRVVNKTFRKQIDDYSSYINSDYFTAIGVVLPLVRGGDSPLGTQSIVDNIIHRKKATLANAAWMERSQRVCYRIELVADNPDYVEAHAMDLAALEHKAANVEGAAKQAALDEVTAIRKMREQPSKRHYVFELDKLYGFSITRSEERLPDGRLLIERVMGDFVQLTKNPSWLPRTCDVKEYAPSSAPWLVYAEPVMLQRYQVLEVHTNQVDEGNFKLPFNKAGTMVADRTLPEAALAPDGAVNYVVPARAEDLDAVIAEAREKVAQKSFWSKRYVYIIAVNVLLISLIVVWYLRRRKKGV